MIDAEAVIEIGAAPGPLPQPGVVAPCRIPRPSDTPAAPSPGRSGEASGGSRPTHRMRNWCCRDQTSALCPLTMKGKTPKIPTPPQSRRARLPLAVGEPLQVLVIEDGVGEAQTSAGVERPPDRGRAARGCQSRHVDAVVLVVQRPEERVVVQPPALAFGKRPRNRRRAACPALCGARERRGRRDEGDALQRADGAEIHGWPPAHPLEPGAIGRIERRLAARFARTPRRRGAR